MNKTCKREASAYLGRDSPPKVSNTPRSCPSQLQTSVRSSRRSMALRTSSAVVAKDCFPNPLRTWGAICRGSKSGHSKVEINVDEEVHVVANT